MNIPRSIIENKFEDGNNNNENIRSNKTTTTIRTAIKEKTTIKHLSSRWLKRKKINKSKKEKNLVQLFCSFSHSSPIRIYILRILWICVHFINTLKLQIDMYQPSNLFYLTLIMDQISHQLKPSKRDSHHIRHHHPTLVNSASISRDSNRRSLVKMDKDELKPRESIIKMNAKLNIKHNTRIPSPAVMSLILVIYVLSNQSFMSSILEAGKGFTFVASNDSLVATSRRETTSGLINFVSADPAPLPAPSSNSRSSTSRTNRGPPINGSMFGKRSVDNLSRSSAKQPAATTTPAIDYNKAKSKQNNLNSQQSLKSSPAIKLHSVSSYHDIVTEIIENFLASNNESKYQIRLQAVKLSRSTIQDICD